MRKYIKRILVLCISLIFIFVNTADFWASDNFEREVVIKNGEYSFVVKEIDKGDKGVVRIYSNEKQRSMKGIEETKNLLYALGYNEKSVENLSVDELMEYATAPEIVVSVAYMKTNENGTLEYVDEDIALKEAEVKREYEEERINNLVNGIATAFYEIDTEMDNYMKVTYSLRNNGAVCYGIVIAEWLTMPIVRSYDSIGGCGQYMTCTPGSGECTVYYDRKMIISGTVYEDSIESTVTDIEEVNESGWAGMAATFKLPSDWASTDYTILHSNYMVIFKYQGMVSFPQTSVNFNAIGSYTHTTIDVAVCPSVSIDTSGANAGIGLSVALFKDRMSVWLEVNYVP